MTTGTTTPARPAPGACATPFRRRGLAVSAPPRRIAVELTPRAIEQIATRVAQLLHQDPQAHTPELLTAGELARYLRVERPWVYKNRHLLGGQRIGKGPRAQWRFERQTAMQVLERHRTQQPGQGGS